MSYTNDTIHLSIKQMNRYIKTNNLIKSIKTKETKSMF